MMFVRLDGYDSKHATDGKQMTNVKLANCLYKQSFDKHTSKLQNKQPQTKHT